MSLTPVILRYPHRVGKPLKTRLIIRSSSIHAAGCYTLRPVRQGEKVCEYDGPRYRKDVADERYKDRSITYLFSCGEAEMVIDGFGTAMFINHSCEPNCESEEQDGHIFISALRRVEAGEELTYQYNLHDSDDEVGTCHCGSAACGGTMFSEAELRRRQKRDRAELRPRK